MFSQNKKWEIENILQQLPITHCDIAVRNRVLSDYFTQVTAFSFQPSERAVFFDERQKGYPGLSKQQVLLEDKPVYLIDNHDKALMAFWDVYQETNAPLSVVHIDAHRDDAVFPFEVRREISKEYISLLLTQTRVSDYLDVGVRLGLIGRVHTLTQSFEFESFQLPAGDFVLNLDIDIFGEDGAMVPLKTKLQTIVDVWSCAQAVVVATSPGFIEASDAQYIIERLVEKMHK